MFIVRLPFKPFGFYAITVWPFIFIWASAAVDQALLAHERTHAAEQARWLVLPWWLAYLLSRRFRFAAEVRAYTVQIRLGGISVYAAADLLMRYRLGISFDEARGALNVELKRTS